MTTGLAGKDFLLKIESSPNAGTYTTVGGMRSNNFTINDETVDITSKDSGGFREYLAGAGLRSVSASGSGVFKNDQMLEQINNNILTGAHARWQLIVPGFGTYSGPFAVTSLDMSGEYNGELTYSIALESAGAISFAAL